MSHVSRDYRVRIHQRGTQDPTDATAEYTLGVNRLAEIPSFGGVIIFPAEGRTEARPWTVNVVDANGEFTATLADADGRMHLIGRVVEYQVQTNGGAWVTRSAARLAYVGESDGPGLFSIQVEDERWVERNTTIFQRADTTQIYPAGLRCPWYGFAAAGPDRRALIRDFLGGSEVLKIELGAGRFPQRAIPWIERDLLPEANPRRTSGGNFKTLRLNIEGTDYPIIAFRNEWNGDSFTDGLEAVNREGGRWGPLHVWIDGTGLSLPSGNLFTAFLHAAPGTGFPAEPSDGVPLHIGVADADHPYGTAHGGIHPFELVRRLYDEAGVRYDPVALEALIADKSYPLVRFRITGPENLGRFLEDNIFRPFGAVPFIDSLGRVRVQSTRLPRAVDTGTLFTFNAGNCVSPPTFEHASRELVNRIRFEYEIVHAISEEQRKEDGDFAADGIRSHTAELERQHDNVDVTLPREVRIPIRGLPRTSGVTIGSLGTIITLARTTAAIAREIFDRYGDGPIQGRIVGLPLATESVEPGDLVLLDHTSLRGPNPVTGTRSSARLVQIVDRTVYPDRIEFDYLDAGPTLQPLPTPTVTVSQNASDPKHAVDITVSGVPAGAVTTVQIAIGPDTPTEWPVVFGDLGNETFTVRELPSGTKIWARGSTAAPGRIRSAWSTPSSHTTTALTPPTGLTESNVTRSTADFQWVNGEAAYPIQLLLTLGGAPQSWTLDDVVRTLPAGTTQDVVAGLDGPAVQHTVAVRHVDPFGGVSSVTQRTFSTTSVLPNAPRPPGIAILIGLEE